MPCKTYYLKLCPEEIWLGARKWDIRRAGQTLKILKTHQEDK
jgi:hypothetical protein